VQWGTQEGVLNPGSRVVLIASSNWAAKGHDQLMVHTVK
jgi:hypothetical protein